MAATILHLELKGKRPRTKKGRTQVMQERGSKRDSKLFWRGVRKRRANAGDTGEEVRHGKKKQRNLSIGRNFRKLPIRGKGQEGEASDGHKRRETNPPAWTKFNAGLSRSGHLMNWAREIVCKS